MVESARWLDSRLEREVFVCPGTGLPGCDKRVWRRPGGELLTLAAIRSLAYLIKKMFRVTFLPHMGEAEQTRFFHFSFRTYLTQIAVTLLGAAIMILTARVLGPAGKGMLTLLVMIPVLATALFHLGIGQATVFFAPRVLHA